MSENPAVRITSLSASYGKEEVLRDINLSLNSGEVVAVVGPNGAGKTTLFRAILGLIPYSGSIEVFGRKPKEALGRIGYVPQRFEFDRGFPLKVREFLSLSMRSKDHSTIDKALEEVDISSLSERLIGELSGGQLQRVLISRALINSPDILLMDEPTSGIDMEGETGFYDIIGEQNKEYGRTVLIITHEINMAYKYATQVICLNRDLYCYGTPKEAITRELLSKLYGKDVEMRGHKH